MSGELMFSSAELAAMRSVQDAHMMDTCTIDVYTEGAANDYGAEVVSWVSGAAIACGFHPVATDELLDSSDVPVLDAKLRLPIATVIASVDRVTITQRHGVAVPAVQYELMGEPLRGPSGLVCELKMVVD